MGIYSKLLGRKQDAPKNEVAEETTKIEITPNNETDEGFVEKLNIDTSQTLEKFLPLIDEILIFLTDILQKLHKLEQEIFERSQALKNPLEPNKLQPGEKELWAEYKRRHNEITIPICLNPSEEGSRSFGEPTKYEYLTYPDTKVTFTMKSANRAVVEMYYEYGIKRKDQFVLKKDEAGWKIDTKKYGFQNEDTWHKDEL